MKKVLNLFVTLVLFFAGSAVFADDAASAKAFFNQYVNYANSYSNVILDLYAPNAKIIRQVVKPNGQLVNATTNAEVYKKQMSISQSIAKMRNYKNTYRNVTVTKVANGYKISAERQPTNETYWLKVYQIVQKQPNGKWIIVEELMQTKEQIFLRYADK